MPGRGCCQPASGHSRDRGGWWVEPEVGEGREPQMFQGQGKGEECTGERREEECLEKGGQGS